MKIGPFAAARLPSLFLVACICCFGAVAQTVGASILLCAPTVTSEALPLVVAQDFTRSFTDVQEIMQLSSERSVRALDVVGATKATLVAKNHTTYDAAGCPVWNVQVGYTDVTVYVAREVAGNACARAHVLEHELRHVQVYRSALDTLALRARARMLTKIQSNSSEQLSVDTLLGAAMGEVALTVPEHLAIDTDEEVSLNQTACDGAIAHAYRRWRKWRNG